ncbi:Glyoxylase, beta-lactamase superfamily II [Anaerobranca californiensis DSM 14826]|uniref:Glyoxylase, beta-lactamase superfamily II n=1 Tax=Anaerobranca californiensis DSM 14826 TaxID=1120989 RepID=A0A1M6R9G7_9FIRM|nr:MBL fold metallo-hydrolase [Anaerobranca californiensis]SHK29129.1 Glyoxylase, beta-lactamase superfamily II [Anaerobranca californiensis DSM 14826]
MENVYKDIYKLEIPLPDNPLKKINTYLIKGAEKSLLIDTGFNHPTSKEVLLKGLKELKVTLDKIELFVTHLHSDHSGLAGFFSNQGVKVYASNVDGPLINEMTGSSYWERLMEKVKLYNLEIDNITYEDNPGYKYCAKEPIDFELLKEGDPLKVGDYTFEVVDISGHTPGQIGLYERNHKLFFGGDHVLDQITPNIAFWGFQYNSLDLYLNNLEKISQYSIDYLFPSHRNIIRDHRRRIEELINHHEKRLEEVLNILKGGEKTVRNVAKEMKWSSKLKNWEEFPSPQKWFAAGEAMSHLEHLVLLDRVERTNKDGILYYKV